MMRLLIAAAVLILLSPGSAAQSSATLAWNELPPLPNELGVAGPFAGVHNDCLVVAGGANFSTPVWEHDKAWHDAIYVLVREGEGDQVTYTWKEGVKLPRPTAYGAAVSTSKGVVCIGGNDANDTFADVYLLSVDAKTHEVTRTDFPALPGPCAFGGATLIGSTIYLAGGQNDQSLDSAMANFWSLDLADQDTDAFSWKQHDGVPWPTRALCITASQHDGFNDSVYVISGRRQNGDQVEFLKDVWQYTPKTDKWTRRADAPQSVMAGTGIGFGQSHIFVLGGADGRLWGRENELLDDHPGFPKQAWAYHTITDTWTSAGKTPRNHVTTIAVKWDDAIIVPSGEVRPRVRSPKIWRVTAKAQSTDFGMINYGVLFGYLLAMVGVGVYFAGKNKDTDEYFRGGKSIPWWAADQANKFSMDERAPF